MLSVLYISPHVQNNQVLTFLARSAASWASLEILALFRNPPSARAVRTTSDFRANQKWFNNRNARILIVQKESNAVRRTIRANQDTHVTNLARETKKSTSCFYSLKKMQYSNVQYNEGRVEVLGTIQKDCPCGNEPQVPTTTAVTMYFGLRGHNSARQQAIGRGYRWYERAGSSQQTQVHATCHSFRTF